MDTGIGRAPPQEAPAQAQRQPTPPLRRPVRRIVVDLGTRPEPFRPFDYERARRVRRTYAWSIAGAAAVVASGLALLVLQVGSRPSLPPRPEPPAVAAVAPAPAPPVVATLPAAPAPQPAAPAPPPPPPPMRELVTSGSGGSNLRAAPSLSGQVLWTAPRGTRLRVDGEEGSWVRVRTPDGGRVGWMHRSVLTEPPG